MARTGEIFPTQIGVGGHHGISLLDEVHQPHLVRTEASLGRHVLHDGLHHGVLVHVARGPHGGGLGCVGPHPVGCDGGAGDVVGALGEGAAVVTVRSVEIPAALRVGVQLEGQDGTVRLYPNLRISLMSSSSSSSSWLMLL